MTPRERLVLRALHGLARLSLRVTSPLKAKGVVDAAARFVPLLHSTERAKAAMSLLDGRGSCLSRSLTVAALLPGSEVVIGVNPSAPEGFHAHAWVELNGTALGDTSTEGVGRIATLRRKPSN